MFFFIPENIIFLVSFFLVVAIGLIELLAMIFGMSLFIHTDDFYLRILMAVILFFHKVLIG